MELAWTNTEKKNNKSVAKQALQWTPKGHRNSGKQKKTPEKIASKKCVNSKF